MKAGGALDSTRTRACVHPTKDRVAGVTLGGNRVETRGKSDIRT